MLLFNHAPEDYVCPFCLIAAGVENEHVLTKQSDVIYRDEFITAFVSAGWWENNKGHVIIIPNRHFENLYDLPPDYSAEIHSFEKQIAVAFKRVYKCDGVSSRQRNEPAGNQDVWHYHLHVFPRYAGDNLYCMERRPTTAEERAPYAKLLKDYFGRSGIAFTTADDMPNAETIAAIDETQVMKKDVSIGKSYTNADEMITELLA